MSSAMRHVAQPAPSSPTSPDGMLERLMRWRVEQIGEGTASDTQGDVAAPRPTLVQTRVCYGKQPMSSSAATEAEHGGETDDEREIQLATALSISSAATKAEHEGENDEIEINQLATALSISEQTVHLPRIHAFLTSQSEWLEPTSSFLHFACMCGLPNAFVAFHKLVQELLITHLLDAVQAPGGCAIQQQEGGSQSPILTLAAFAQVCVLAADGGFLDDVSWVDDSVLEQVRLIRLVESEELFSALLHDYHGLFDDDRDSAAEGAAEQSRWGRYFEVGLATLAPAAGVASGTWPMVDLDLHTQGFAQVESPIQGNEVEMIQLLRPNAVGEAHQSLAAALKVARGGR